MAGSGGLGVFARKLTHLSVSFAKDLFIIAS
jgi:hypothetical protein